MLSSSEGSDEQGIVRMFAEEYSLQRIYENSYCIRCEGQGNSLQSSVLDVHVIFHWKCILCGKQCSGGSWTDIGVLFSCDEEARNHF